jgi:hypothetical protein
MKAFSNGKSRDRQSPRRNDPHAPEKGDEGIELPAWNPEELYQTQALIQDLDKHFTGLRETLQRRRYVSTRSNVPLNTPDHPLPPRRSWWRRWFPW